MENSARLGRSFFYCWRVFSASRRPPSWSGEEFSSIVTQRLSPPIGALIISLLLSAVPGLSQDMFAPESPLRRTNTSNSYCQRPSVRVHLIWQATYTRGDQALEAILRRWHAREVAQRDMPDANIPIATIEAAVISRLHCRVDGGACTRISFLLEGDFLGSAWCGIDGPPPVNRVLPRTLRIQGASISP